MHNEPDDHNDAHNAHAYYQTDRNIKIQLKEDIKITEKPNSKPYVELKKSKSQIDHRKSQSCRFTEYMGPALVQKKRVFDLICDSGNQYQRSTFGFKPNPMTITMLESHKNKKDEEKRFDDPMTSDQERVA